MLELEHLATLLAFILLGGFGMAAMQDGMACVWKRLATMLAHHRRAMSLPARSNADPLMFKR